MTLPLNATCWTAFSLELYWSGRILPPKNTKQKIQKHGPHKNKTKQNSMLFYASPNSNYFQVTVTYGNLLALCTFHFVKFTLKQVLRLLGPRNGYRVLTKICKMQLVFMRWALLTYAARRSLKPCFTPAFAFPELLVHKIICQKLSNCCN